jgi:diaminohydroxyphosphoribosylaminopyrimidine deaminase/5-amino-6-(5-phosphoribosylamino)uracil reductase
MTEDSKTVAFMNEAFRLARRGLGRTSPNPAVGALLVKDGETIGRGFHVYGQLDHAEIVALREAGERARGASLYITLEPCPHQGRTPPCASALIAAGVARVVAAMEDPNPLVSGAGFRMLREAGIEVAIASSYTAEAEKLNEPFVHFQRTRRPLVTLKAALTLDGKIAAPEDNTGWITSDLARAHVQQVRHMHDAIMTGIGTVLADDPMLNDRSGIERSRPLLRIVLDSQLRLPPTARIVEACAGDVLVITTSASSDERRRLLEERGVRVLTMNAPDGRTNLRRLVEWLGAEQYQSLMIEAGSKVNWAALEAGIVDKIFFYYAPKILGGTQSLPVAGGAGRKRRADAIIFRDLVVHSIAPNEFAVEAYVAEKRL